jgi:predicted nuclease of predicted toxin-antitoxin system
MAAKLLKSKKRSATSLLPDLPLYLDEDIDSARIYEALIAMRVDVYRHRDYFAQGEKDHVWLPTVAANGWIVLTKDEAMQRGEIEKIAIRNAKARVFILVRGDLSAQEMAEIFVKALSPMARVVRKHPAPFIAKVYRSGSVLKTDLV